MLIGALRKVHVFINGKVELIGDDIIYKDIDLNEYELIPISKYIGLPMFDHRYFEDEKTNNNSSCIYGTYTLERESTTGHSLNWSLISFDNFPPEFKTYLLLNGWTI